MIEKTTMKTIPAAARRTRVNQLRQIVKHSGPVLTERGYIAVDVEGEISSIGVRGRIGAAAEEK
jgi:hypothetical protein